MLDLEKDPTPGDPHRVRSLAQNLLAELTVWGSGEAQLQLGDLADGHVAEEHLRLADAGELAAAVERMMAWATRQGD
ncbi:hypothetical protein [Streptomyces sp. NPDC015345]|uniref:hypothetical protein n=1 Tax=Streptomyces sp. NPDC015345 TaxID=3364953 RepID=UPI003700E2FA